MQSIEDTPIIYRRKYTCPNCKHKGKTHNKNRNSPVRSCPVCGVKFKVQVQRKDATYDTPCRLVDEIEYYI